MNKYMLFGVLLFVSAIRLAIADTSYNLKFHNKTQGRQVSLLLDTSEGVAAVSGINPVNPINLAAGSSKEVKFLIKGNATAWQMRFKVCSNEKIAANKCANQETFLCQFDASGIGEVPFYMSNSQTPLLNCSPKMIANTTHVDFVIEE